LHEFEVFAIGDKPGRKLVGFQVLLMTGCLIVVAEPVSLIAYFNETSVKTTPFQGGRGGGARKRMAIIGRVQRALREQMLDVGQHKFLVLLLMMHSQHREYAQ